MERPRDHCIRCGECCLRSSPSLQITDAPLVYEGPIKRVDLYTIRVGELVQNNIRDELKATDTVATTEDGLQFRVTRDSDFTKNQNKVRSDFRPAYGVMNPFFAGQGFGTP